MRLLVLLSSHQFQEKYEQHAKASIESLQSDPTWTQVDVFAIGSNNDFLQYDIPFSYMHTTKSKQLTKITEVFQKYPNLVDSYDWFIKLRPDIQLHQCLDFSDLRTNTIYARAREYQGPKRVPFGASICKRFHAHVYAQTFRMHPELRRLVLDDQLYLFHAEVVKNGAFAPLPDSRERQEEWFHAKVWESRNVPVDIIGLHVTFLRDGYASGNI